jgi:hypothetical protein
MTTKNPYSVILVDARGLSQADKDEACEKFRASLNAHFGEPKKVATAYAAYWNAWVALDDAETTSMEQVKQIDVWKDAKNIAESAAFEDWVGDPGGAHFEVEVAT